MIRLDVQTIARRNKGLNMREVAELGLDHQTVMYWNQGRSYPRLPTLLQLCRLLECTVEDLIVEDIQAGEAEPLEYFPERRRGHAPQIVTSQRYQMG